MNIGTEETFLKKPEYAGQIYSDESDEAVSGLGGQPHASMLQGPVALWERLLCTEKVASVWLELLLGC